LGIFSKKIRDTRTPSDLAAIDLDDRLDFGRLNYHGISDRFVSLAFPDSPIFSDQSFFPTFPTTLSSGEVRAALERFVAGSISADELAQLVFGFDTIGKFVGEIFKIEKLDADKRWAGIWWLLFMAGIRRGEILGLTWEHVNLDARTVRIELNRIRVGKVDVVKAPKTEKGRRTIELDEVTIDLLREWRTAQMAERLASGSGWLGGDLTTCYVVTEPNGSPTHSSSFGRRYRALLKRAGVPIYALHEARHTSITQLAPILSAHALSRRAGHSSVAFTYDRYAHAMPQESFDAINALSAKVTRRRAK